VGRGSPSRPEFPALDRLAASAAGLEHRQGYLFDTQFMKTAIAGHKDILTALTRAPSAGAPLELRDLLEDARRIERQHLDVAIAVFARLGVAW
jgi:hypothetical protein